MHALFHASVLRPASQVRPIYTSLFTIKMVNKAPMHKTAGMGKLINAALLSLINEACVSVCCATLLLSQLVSPACVQARSSNPRGKPGNHNLAKCYGDMRYDLPHLTVTLPNLNVL